MMALEGGTYLHNTSIVSYFLLSTRGAEHANIFIIQPSICKQRNRSFSVVNYHAPINPTTTGLGRDAEPKSQG